jgi:hypothetical protein
MGNGRFYTQCQFEKQKNCYVRVCFICFEYRWNDNHQQSIVDESACSQDEILIFHSNFTYVFHYLVKCGQVWRLN